MKADVWVTLIGLVKEQMHLSTDPEFIQISKKLIEIIEDYINH